MNFSKTYTTQRHIKDRYEMIIPVKNGMLDYLLAFETPEWFTGNAEGWGADIYTFGSSAIATGRVPFGNFEIDAKDIAAVNAQAREIINSAAPVEEKKEQTDLLLRDFVHKARTAYEKTASDRLSKTSENEAQR